MIDDRELFERAAERFAPPEGSFERLVTRRDRKHRNKRITAGVVALVVAAAGTGALLRAFTTGPIPADTPEQPSVDLGIFAPAAGRIVYCDNPDLWSVDPSAPSPISTLELVGDRLCAPTNTWPLGWSSDGTQLLVVREDPTDVERRYLYILHADGTETQVTPGRVDTSRAGASSGAIGRAPPPEGADCPVRRTPIGSAASSAVGTIAGMRGSVLAVALTGPRS